ncbi:rhodanese-like domain-containing protein [Paraoerskovia sediminicola]|uniref:rhodanese-like domain-containing protein n=1 Tax=Paraoerskovia sediminicola TaxID=1138587 RepID=UPI003D9BEC99
MTELLGGADAYAAFCGLPSSGDGSGAAARTGSGGRPEAFTAADLAAVLDDGLGDWGGSVDPDRPRPVLLDVREDWEAQIVAIPGARLVPSGTFVGGGVAARSALADLPRDRPVLVLCKVGGRSATVAAAARDVGVDARSVAGGILAWVRGYAPGERTY